MKIYKDPELNVTMFDSNIHLTELSSITLTPDNAQDNMARSMFNAKARAVQAISIIEMKQ